MQKKFGTAESNVLLVTNAWYRINSVIRMATGEHEHHRPQIFNTPVMSLRNEALSSCRLLALHVGCVTFSQGRAMYSDTSANEDNSFRNHIR